MHPWTSGFQPCFIDQVALSTMRYRLRHYVTNLESGGHPHKSTLARTVYPSFASSQQRPSSCPRQQGSQSRQRRATPSPTSRGASSPRCCRTVPEQDCPCRIAIRGILMGYLYCFSCLLGHHDGWPRLKVGTATHISTRGRSHELRSRSHCCGVRNPADHRRSTWLGCYPTRTPQRSYPLSLWSVITEPLLTSMTC